MKTNLFLLTIICLSIVFSSCEKTVTFDSLWKDGNEAQFTKIEKDPSYTKLESASKNGFIMYKKITESKSGVKPYFSDNVKVLYTGWYKNEWTKDNTYTNSDGNKITNKIIFDSTNVESNGSPKGNIIPREFPLSGGVIDGFSTALQHMEVGDKWEIWIPWNLGYGATTDNRSGIRGYTTLVFEVELVEIL